MDKIVIVTVLWYSTFKNSFAIDGTDNSNDEMNPAIAP